MIDNHIYADSDGNEYSTEKATGDVLYNSQKDGRKVVYSKDLKRLFIIAESKFGPDYTIRSGTKVVCAMAFFNKDYLVNITFPDGLLAIGSSAFSRCDGIEQITIPASVVGIENKAFAYMSKLKRVIFEGVVAEIDPTAFIDDGAIESVSVPIGSADHYKALLPKYADKVTEYDPAVNAQAVAETDISSTPEGEVIVIPDGTPEIEESQFADLTAVKKIIIPDSVEIINDYAFRGCTALEQVVMSAAVQYIGVGAFEGCSSLQEISIPEGVLELSDNTFKDCKSLSRVCMLDTLISIGDGAFRGCLSLKNIDLPQSLGSIGADAFRCCGQLETVELPESVYELGARAFAFCKSLRRVVLSQVLTELPAQVFFGCVSLKNIFLPAAIESIGDEAFAACVALQEITLPEGINCPPSAFYDCPNIKVKYGATKDGGFKTPIDELNSLIGLASVKQEVRSFVELIKIQNKRASLGLRVTAPSYHCVFTGNPGTGKTTVARIMADIYKELGIVAKGHLVETDRASLVGERMGETAVKTNRVIDSALDGVLFIDEAYTLSQDNDPFGREAINTLLKRMEDERGRLVIFLAGYTREIQTFINTNPGLQSRFNHYIEFPDYDSDELFEIFCINMRKYMFKMTEGAESMLREILDYATASKDQNFGNGRYVRNLFDSVVANQASRLSQSSNLSTDELSLITEDDLTNI